MTHEWTFQKKVLAGFGVMVCLAAVTAGVAVYALRSVVAGKDRVISTNAELLVNAARLRSAVHQESVGFRGFLLIPEERFLVDVTVDGKSLRRLCACSEKRLIRMEAGVSSLRSREPMTV